MRGDGPGKRNRVAHWMIAARRFGCVIGPKQRVAIIAMTALYTKLYRNGFRQEIFPAGRLALRAAPVAGQLSIAHDSLRARS